MRQLNDDIILKLSLILVEHSVHREISAINFVSKLQQIIVLKQLKRQEKFNDQTLRSRLNNFYAVIFKLYNFMLLNTCKKTKHL